MTNDEQLERLKELCGAGFSFNFIKSQISLPIATIKKYYKQFSIRDDKDVTNA